MMMGDLILIDRSAMLEAIDKRERIVRKFAPDLQEDEIRPTLKSIREFIANRPIVDAEPVRHGTWEKRTYWIGSFGENQMVCSECGIKYGFHAQYNYCPNCGAKMDGSRAESHT